MKIVARWSPRMLLVGLILVGAVVFAARPAQAQDSHDTVRMRVYHDGALKTAAEGTVLCPGDVPVGSQPLTIDFEATTTSPNPVQYTATFSFSNQTLDATVTSDTHGNPAPVVDGGTTTYTVQGLLSNTMPFRVSVVTTATAAGPAATDWEVRRAGVIRQEEHCTFNVIEGGGGSNGADLDLRITDIQGALAYDPAAKTATLPLGQEVNLCIRVTNNGPDEATQVTIAGGADPAVFEVRDAVLDPAIGTCTPDAFGGFTCTELTLEEGATVDVNVLAAGLATTSERSFSAATAHPNDPDFSNNSDAFIFTVEEGTPAADLEIRVEDIQGALGFDPTDNTAALPLNHKVTIRARVTNNGPNDAARVDISVEGNPAFFAMLTARLDPDIGTCRIDRSGVLCAGLTLAAGASVVVIIEGAGIGETGAFSLNAMVGGGFPGDPDLSDNRDLYTIAVEKTSTPTVLAVTPITLVTLPGVSTSFLVFTCPDADADGRPDVGEDGVPGTEDDACFPTQNASWSVVSIVGTLLPGTGPTTTYTSTLERGIPFQDGLVVAEADDQVGVAEVRVQTGIGAIHGQKFFDADEDGIKDPDEVGINGIEMILKDANGLEVARDTTRVIDVDGDGFLDPFTEHGLFRFENLLPGAYTVTENLDPFSFTPTTPKTQPALVANGGADTLRFGNFTAFLDWGDLPDLPYFTTSFFGAVHGIRDGLTLGVTVDAEDDGQPTLGADGDDLNGDDEDGLVRLELLADGTARVFMTVSLPPDVSRAELHGWIDFDDDGFLHPRDERVVAEVITGTGTYFPTFPVPPGAVLRYARFRLSSAVTGVTGTGAQVTMTPYGFWPDGEVEDYLLLVEDYGDAPDAADPTRPDLPAGYPTRLADDGARHFTVNGIRLGFANDGEADGAPTTEADGDDNNTLYDEDGIVFQDGFFPVAVRPEPRTPAGLVFRYGIGQGTQGTVLPLASVQGKLDAWIDFNRDGDWADPGEQVFDSEDVQSGPDFTPLTFAVPDDAAPGYTFARFRFSQRGDLGFDGPAPNGEVEDYLLQILDAQAVTSAADSGPGSLRQAIADAIARAVPALFDLSSLGKQAATIQLRSPLPAVTVPVVLRGAGAVLDGSAAGSTADGLVLAAGGSVVTGLTIQGFAGHGLALESDDNLIQDNTITANGGDGVRVLGQGNTLLGNAITANGGPGIDLGGDGPTANDPGETDGLQNAPRVASAVASDSTRINGSLSSTPEAAFRLEFFANAACDDGGSGEGAVPLGAATVTTDTEGRADFAVSTGTVLARDQVVTATATGPDGTTSEFSQCVVATDLQETHETGVPEAFHLHANYPNPFNPETVIRFDLPHRARVRLQVFNVLGQVVATLVDKDLAAGAHRAIFDGRHLPSGVYFYRLTAGSYRESRPMTLLR